MKKRKITVALYGMGLMGGSLGLALKGKGYQRIGIGRNRSRLAQALRAGAVDRVTVDLAGGLRRADLVVLALPVARIVPVLKKIRPLIGPETVVTDVGSVKATIMRGARSILPRMFVGSHPMAGSEKSGIRFASKKLFIGAGCLVVPGKNPSWVIDSVKRLWKDAGARVMIIDAQTHDKLVAMVSHLPHVVAYAMTAYFSDVAKKNECVARMFAGSFRDITRVAMSDPAMWSQIMRDNKTVLRSVIRKFNQHIGRISSVIDRPERSLRIFKKAAAVRTQLERQR